MIGQRVLEFARWQSRENAASCRTRGAIEQQAVGDRAWETIGIRLDYSQIPSMTSRVRTRLR